MYLEFYSLLCFVVPCAVWQIYQRKKLPVQERSVRHLVWTCIFMFYCYLAVHAAAGMGTLWDLLAAGRLVCSFNFIPFASEGIMTYLLNIVMFVPFGFLLPLIWKPFRSLGTTVLAGLGFSACIEFFQLFSFRTVDVDDLLMNTLGTLVGYLLWRLFSLLYKKTEKETVMFCRAEPFIYILLGMFGLFFLYHWRLFY